MSEEPSLKSTPLHAWHQANGGRMVDFSGWSMPVQYRSILEEHQMTRQAVGLFDISHMARLGVVGHGAAAWLDHLHSRKVLDLQPGRVRYSLVLNEAGGVLDDVLVSRLDNTPDGSPRFMVVVNAGNHHKIVAWWKRQPSEGLKWTDRSQETSMLAVQGPAAWEVLKVATGWQFPDLGYYHVTSRKVSQLAGLSLGSGVSPDAEILVSRTGYTGEDGCELIFPQAATLAIWEALMAAASRVQGGAVGLGARDTLRLEAGMPLYGHELSETVNPWSAGLAFAVTLADRQFIGRPALVKAPPEQVPLRRVGLKLIEKRIARQGAPVYQQQEVVGEVTSGAFCPSVNASLAMAYVPQRLALPGTLLQIDIRGKFAEAEVVTLPFYTRPRGPGAA